MRGKTSVVGLTQEYDTDPNQPLFILDGFESTLKAISNLSMDRVASITVLKDAAATAFMVPRQRTVLLSLKQKLLKPENCK